MAASPDTKNDLILGAFSQLRISGITIIPNATQLNLALRRLENSMAELFEIWNIGIPYNFEDDPDFSSPHNLPRGLFGAVEVYIAVCLAPDFGKQIPISLATRLKGAMGSLFKYSAKAPRVDYPDRMPRGAKESLLYRYTDTQIPISSKTIEMYVGDRRDDIIESFITQFNESEIIDTYTVEVSSSELTVNADSNDNYSITLDITATGNSSGSSSQPEIKLTVVTDDDNIFTRIIKFSLLESEI